MKVVTSISAVLLLAVSAAGQLASSHAPATAKRPTVFSDNAPVQSVGGKPVARVNGVALTDRDLLREEYAIFPYARQHGGMPKSMEPQIRQGAMEMIIFEELVYQEAQRRKLVIPSARIDRGERDFKTQFPNANAYREYLARECGGSRQVLRQLIRRSLLIEKLMKLEVQDKVTVTESDARSYYKRNPKQFQVADSYAIQSISILPQENATPAQLADAKKRAETAYAQAKVTKSYTEFGLLAEKLSEDDFRVNMGDHRNVPLEKMPPELIKIASTMKPGDISELVRLGNAYTVFRLNAHTPSGQMKFEAVRQQLISGLRKDKYNQLRTDLNNRLRKNAKVEVING